MDPNTFAALLLLADRMDLSEEQFGVLQAAANDPSHPAYGQVQGYLEEMGFGQAQSSFPTEGGERAISGAEASLAGLEEESNDQNNIVWRKYIDPAELEGKSHSVPQWMIADPNRLGQIRDSLASTPQAIRSSASFTPQDLGFGDLSKKAPVYLNRGTVQIRDSEGRFGRGIGSFAENVASDVQSMVRSILMQRYTDLGIGKVTGTLFESLEKAQVRIDRDDENGFVVHVEPLKLTREARENEPAGVPTELYGSWVFLGRRAIVPLNYKYLRFKIGGEWITSRNVRATGPKDVFDFTQDQRDRIARTAGIKFAAQVVSGLKF